MPRNAIDGQLDGLASVDRAGHQTRRWQGFNLDTEPSINASVRPHKRKSLFLGSCRAFDQAMVTAASSVRSLDIGPLTVCNGGTRC